MALSLAQMIGNGLMFLPRAVQSSMQEPAPRSMIIPDTSPYVDLLQNPPRRGLAESLQSPDFVPMPPVQNYKSLPLSNFRPRQ